MGQLPNFTNYESSVVLEHGEHTVRKQIVAIDENGCRWRFQRIDVHLDDGSVVEGYPRRIERVG
jgi:hypothetical protein